MVEMKALISQKKNNNKIIPVVELYFQNSHYVRI